MCSAKECGRDRYEVLEYSLNAEMVAAKGFCCITKTLYRYAIALPEKTLETIANKNAISIVKERYDKNKNSFLDMSRATINDLVCHDNWPRG